MLHYLCPSKACRSGNIFNIWLAPRAGKMYQILQYDWLLERARWSYLACSGLPKNHIIHLLLTKLVRPRWLDIGVVFFFSEFMDLDYILFHKQAKKNLVNIQPSGHSLLNGTKVSKHRDCLGNIPFRFLRGRPRTQFKRQFKNWRFCAMRKSITIN